MKLKYPERLKLAHLPTPIEEMPRLSQLLGGPKLFVKRDDMTGLAMGGNKTRKLEFLVADAKSRGCDSLITIGAPQSNHCRQTAAAAARVNMDCHLVLRGEELNNLTGNLLLDHLLGARIHWTNGDDPESIMEELAGELTSVGRHPYKIPLGGSNGLGALGYIVAMEEAMSQLATNQLKIDVMLLASSSGGTQSGLIAGAHILGFAGQILGVSIEHSADTLKSKVESIFAQIEKILALPLKHSGGVEVNADYVGAGYGIMGEAEREAIELVASLEGILIDPVYTGRAMAGLIDLIRQGAFSKEQNILFWHTGGTPALFAYGEQLLE